MARRIRATVLAVVVLAFGGLLLASSATVTAQPVPTELERLCINRYTGQLRYLAPHQSCTSSERELRTIDDLPYTLCVNRYTSAVRYSPSGNCTASERAFPLPDSLPISFCVNRYTSELRWRSAAQSCPATSFSAAISQVEPLARDDSYSVLADEDLIVPAEPTGLLANDVLGVPAGTLTSFGGGDLGGTVTSNDPGDTVSLAGGALTVNADGSFSLVNPTVPGDYSFGYRLTNDAATSDATVTLQVQQLPVAEDDGPYTTLVNVTLEVTTGPDDLLFNDDLGFPEAVITSFGIAEATEQAAGESVGLAGGVLTVNADGSFSLVSPSIPGDYSFLYRLANAAGFDDATVTIQVQDPPLAEDDGPYLVLVDTNLEVDSAPDGLLANDELGTPAAELVSFGGGDLGGDVETNAAGDTVSLAGGALTVNADGSFTLIGPDEPGQYSFQYRLENASGTSDATVTIQVQQAPLAEDDGPYTTLVNVTLEVGSGPEDLLANDELGFPEATLVSFGGGDLGGDVESNAAGDSVGLAGGVLTVTASGTLTLTLPSQPGAYTFLYRLENDAGSSDATVTIQVQDPPLAEDDGPYTVDAGDDLVVDADPDGLLANDYLGTPPATLTTFGGGDLGGDVMDNAAGSTVSLAGGDLTVNADGSFSLLAPTEPGEYSFEYRLENASGSSEATVTIEVQGAPVAVDDGPAADSAPGDPFHTALNTTLNSTTSPNAENLLANDQLGFPLGEIVSFGGGDVSSQVTDNAAGAEATFGSGALIVNADGSFVFTPQADFTGLFTFAYRLANSVGFDDATVTIAVGVRPEALDDSYAPTVLGNVFIDTTTSTSFSVLTNDSGDGIAITGFDNTSANGGEVTLNADGTFSYDPPAGFEGDDSFGYTLDNGFGDPQTATVSLTVAGMIWFVDAAAPAGGDGRLSSPFNCLVSAACFSTLADDDPGDRIFLSSGSYTGGLTLLNEQRLIGQGASATLAAVSGLTPPADSSLPATGGAAPQITTTNADALILGQTNLLRGFAIGDTGTGTGITGTSFGTLTAGEVSVEGTGRALNLSTGTLAASFATITVTSSATQGVNLVSVAGTLTMAGGSIASVSGTAFNVDGGNAVISYGGTLTNAAGRVVMVQNRTGGSVSFSGAIADTGTGILLNANTGGTTSFGGGLTLSTGANPAMTATSGGTLVVTGAANTLTTTTGTALNVSTTTIGAGGLTFQSISSNGAASGIILNNTGTSGGLTVTGTGAANSGGTIQNSTGSGISLTQTANVSFMNIIVQNSGSHGISGTNVRNLTLQNSLIAGNGDAAGENGVHIENLLGTSAITGTTFQNNQTIHLFVRTATSTVVAPAAPQDVLTLSGNTFQTPGATFGDNISIESNTAGNFRAVMNASVGNNAFTGGQDALQGSATSGGTLEVEITQATVNDVSGSGINLGGFNVATLRFNVSGVTATNLGSIGINATSLNGATISGTIQNNTIDGSTSGQGIQSIVEGNGSAIVRIDNNTIGNIALEHGIRVISRGGTGRMDATITNNTVNNPAPDPLNPPLEGIYVESGSSSGGDANIVCLNMANNNSVVGGDPADEGYRLRTRSAGVTFYLQDFVGNGASTGDVANWVTTTKSNTGTVQVTIIAAFAAAPSPCQTP